MPFNTCDKTLNNFKYNKHKVLLFLGKRCFTDK